MRSISFAQWLTVAVVLTACGEVEAPAEPDGTPALDGGTVDGPATCTPSLTVSSAFQIESLGGDRPLSALDVTLGHVDGLIIRFDEHNVVRGLDPRTEALTTAVRSSAWRVDFTGPDGDLLDRELGAHLVRGQLYQDAVFQLQVDRLDLFLMPDDPFNEPYVALECIAPSPTNDAGFPILETRAFSNCSMTIYDPRAGVFRYLFASESATFEIAYGSCP